MLNIIKTYYVQAGCQKAESTISKGTFQCIKLKLTEHVEGDVEK